MRFLPVEREWAPRRTSGKPVMGVVWPQAPGCDEPTFSVSSPPHRSTSSMAKAGA